MEIDKKNLGIWITYYELSVIEILKKKHDYTWVVVDLEHSYLDLEHVRNITILAQALDMEVFIRTNSREGAQLSKICDIGIDGIIFSNIKSRQEFLTLSQFCLYPPLGSRGLGFNRSNFYGENIQNIVWDKQTIKLIAQIESKEGADSIDHILSLNECSGIITGPYDLSLNLGIPGQFTDPEFIKSYSQIVESNKRFQKLMGCHIVSINESELKLRINEGFNWIAYGVDINFNIK
jgi:2-keto-3-deoxy-L-rhamnonate aldolase RhmA